jgi:AraC-like DNA-binding protein
MIINEGLRTLSNFLPEDLMGIVFMDHRINIVISHMKHDPDNSQDSLKELAASFNLSPSRLAHLFKAETGTPFTHYLRNRRMLRAKQLLEGTFLSIKEIASQVGVHDESHFVRDFKKLYGVRPTQWRKQFVFDHSDEVAGPQRASSESSMLSGLN